MTETGRLEGCILAASGAKKPELVLKNARIVNVFTETVEEGDIAIENGMIVGIGAYEGNEERDLKGMYVCPGFIDGHIHMESSMVSPKEFERAVLPHGTTAVITDPHEIANVAGESGIQYMMKATKDLNLDVFFMLPSCVPSTDLDEAGAVLKNEHLKSFYENDRVLGLAEMMNGFGVIHSDRDCLEKLKEAGAKRTLSLNVSGPFHSGMLVQAGEKLGKVLEGISLNTPSIPYVANVTADYVTDASKVRDLLTRQVSSSVRWQQSVEAMIADGTDTFVEIGPGKTLSGFMKKISRDVKVMNIEKLADMEKAVEELKH